MSQPVTVAADLDRPDVLVAGLTARQLVILAATTATIYLGWTATRDLLAPLGFAALAVPLALLGAVAALGERDGLPLDRYLLAALIHHATHRRQHPEPDITATAVGEGPAAAAGALDVGRHGITAAAVCTTVPFSLRTRAEQDALIAVFARYLHSLTGPTQICVLAEPLDLSAPITTLRRGAARLDHPALTRAALDHANYLVSLAATTRPLRRRVLLVARETHTAPAATAIDSRLAARDHHARVEHTTQRLTRRLAEATDLLAPAGITLTSLTAPPGGAAPQPVPRPAGPAPGYPLTPHPAAGRPAARGPRGSRPAARPRPADPDAPTEGIPVITAPISTAPISTAPISTAPISTAPISTGPAVPTPGWPATRPAGAGQPGRPRTAFDDPFGAARDEGRGARAGWDDGRAR